MKIIALFIILTSLSFSQSFLPSRPMTSEELGIEVIGNSREVAYTNKEAGVFYTETNAEHRSGWQGWRVFSKEMLEDYRIVVGGRPLVRKDVVRTVVYPHQLKRYYANGIEETVTLLDSLNALVIEVNKVQSPEVAIYPLFSDARSEEDFAFEFSKDILTIIHVNHPVRTPRENYPAAVAVSWVKENLWTGGFYDSTNFGKNFSPAYTKTVNPIPKHIAVFTVGDSAYDAILTMKFVAKNFDSLIAVRKSRMERLLNSSYLRTDNPKFDKSLAWAKISMDALMMNQTRKGIFAGLPWFDNYWGRDTYIALPGAALVTGNYADAREMLRTFAAAQEKNPSSTSLGRIPNQITTTSTSYNTADGTPWFTIALENYFNYSNDKALVEELYPVVKRGIEGTLNYHVDEHNFLTHGDAETWMDAAGPNGSWSPRGNRANDIQGLWYRQLNAGARFASMLGDEKTSQLWRAIGATLRDNYRRYFIDSLTSLSADHLRSDGVPVNEFRPNQMFTVDLLGNDTLAQAMFARVTESLVYPHGVASLSQDDPNFHPYHHYQPYYVQDAAYHNGIVWTWLSGKWIELAVNFGLPDLAFTVTENMSDQILSRGAVGTLSELSDAVPRPGEKDPRHSGTFSQAWSLAEFIRSAYQSYLGVTTVSENGKPLLILSPNLPKDISQISAMMSVGETKLNLSYMRQGEKMMVAVVAVSSSSAPIPYRMDIMYGHKKYQAAQGVIGSDTTFVSIEKNIVTEMVAGKSRISKATVSEDAHRDSMISAIRLTVPRVDPELLALKKPPYRILMNSEIKASNPGTRALVSVNDPVNDDKGGGKFTYPTTPMLKPGSLDVTHFSVAADERNVYFALQFRDLSDPGWHPEYGFQLTYAAIAIDKDRKPGSGQSTVGMNSNYTFGKGFGYENIIYVGGGVRVDDAKGKILAEYLPAEGDDVTPLGDAAAKTIRFAIPVDIIGSPAASWRFAVVIGAQDDHGGAGIGEFRSVDAVGGEWVGGGKTNAKGSNVYDVILPKN